MITAKIIADSITKDGQRMTTMEIEYPRFILAELNTHRMLSKNSASSRAIPVKAMHEHIMQSPATPVFWGKNQAGMQAKEQLTGSDMSMAKYLWAKAKEDAVHWAKALADLELHKQIANRITEPWMTMKTVISGTEWANFFWLRDHADAQPEIAELARKMREAYDASIPKLLNPGEWHVPYVTTYRDTSFGIMYYLDSKDNYITAEEARIISSSCCAQVSYRKNDDSFEKALKIYKQLIESTPAHASPVEHQATPMESEADTSKWDTFDGVTHQDRNGELWSGNLRGWVQFRKLIPNEAKW
jgi:Thymidylate synthase complementing protein